MISPVFRRTRATRFAQLLDEAGGARRKHTRTAHDEELTSLVAVSQQIASRSGDLAGATAADPDFRATLRRRLMAVAASQGIGTEATPQLARDCDTREVVVDPRPGRAARVALAATAIAAVVTLSGVSAASGDAMPGQALYDVKRSTERAQLALAGSDLNRGQLQLEFAATRLAEAAATDDPAARERGMDEMDAATLAGLRLLGTVAVERHSLTPLDAVDAFVGPHQRKVAELATNLTGRQRSRALASLNLLSRVEDRSAVLRQSLMCTNATSVRSDELGPVPGHCTAAPYRGRDSEDQHTRRDKASRDNRDGVEAPGPTETVTPRPATLPSPSRGPLVEDPDLSDVPQPAAPPYPAQPGAPQSSSPGGGAAPREGLLGHISGLFDKLFG